MPESTSPTADGRLRILSINVWNRSGPWDRRLVALQQGIAALAPDLVALQEVLALDGAPRNQAEELADALGETLGYRSAFGPAVDIGGGLKLGNAVLSRFPLAPLVQASLPFFGEDEPRALLGVLAEAPMGPVPFFVTHLNWKLHHGAIRQRQVAFLDETIARLCPRGDKTRFPPILAGDFNAEPLSDEIRFLYGWHALEGRSTYWADAVHVAGPGGDREGRATYAPSENPFAAPTFEPDRRIDYIFSRPDGKGRGRPLHARRVLDRPVAGVFASDHFGVYAELSLGG